MKGVTMWQTLLLRLAVTLALVTHAYAQTPEPALPSDQPQTPGDADPDPADDVPDPRTAPKAPSGEFVKLCGLYGEGFFYIPGTDACLRLGGTLRLDGSVNANGNGGPFIGGTGLSDPANDRGDTRAFPLHARGVLSADTRVQTAWGTLRGNFSGGYDVDSGDGIARRAFLERAYVQFVGLTLGKALSFFDFKNGIYSYGSYYLGGGSNTRETGTLLAAYTYQFGGGLSATVSVEDGTARRNALWDAGTNVLSIRSFPGPQRITPGGLTDCPESATVSDTGIGPLAGCPVGDYAAGGLPDAVLNGRFDQTWGSVQLGGALHEVRGIAYGNDALLPPLGPLTGSAAYTGLAPKTRLGFAAMGGASINMPWAAGDKVWLEGVYTQGALSYAGLSLNHSFGQFWRFGGGAAGAGFGLDGVFANTVAPGAPAGSLAPSGILLTGAWSIGAAYEHVWTRGVRSSVFGVFSAVSYPGQARTIFCSSPVGPVRTAAGATPDFASGAVAGCNPDFLVWGAGVRTIWNPVSNIEVGLEVMYSRLDQNMSAATTRLFYEGSNGRPAGLYVPGDQSVISGLLRLQYNFSTLDYLPGVQKN